jgi:hypothetical protein
MIKNHAEILELYPSTEKLISRISEEYKGEITKEKLKRLGSSFRSARNRGSIGISLWPYLVRVSAVDYMNGETEVWITAKLLLSTSGAR